MINFALGEWAMVGARLAATGFHALALALPAAIGLASAGMIAFALLWNRLVLRRLVGRPLITLIMVTLGLGALMRGAAPLVFSGVPSTIPLPVTRDAISVYGVLVSAEKLTAAA